MPKKATVKKSSAEKTTSSKKSGSQNLKSNAKKRGINELSTGDDIKKINLSPLDALFKEYESSQDLIEPAGIQNLCNDLSISTDDPSLLVLAWYMNTSRMGYITLQEWKNLEAIKIFDLKSLKKSIGQFNRDLNDPNKLKKIFAFTFKFIKEENQKFLNLDVAQDYLKLLLPSNPHTNYFCDFLQVQSKEPNGYQSLNYDQWKMFFEFATTIRKDFSNYQEESAWPVIIDHYVSYQSKKDKMEL